MKHHYPACKKIFFHFSFCLFVFVSRGQDIPGASATLQTAPAGSYVIAMDNVNQAASLINSSTGTYLFNLKVYGFAVWFPIVNYKLRFNYDFTHNYLIERVNFNRIKMVSPAGKATYSEMKIVFDKWHPSRHRFTNQTIDKVQMMVDAKEGEKLLVEFYDILGHLAGQVITTIKNQQAQLNIHQLPSGPYLVVGSTLSGDNYKTKLIIK